MNIQIGNRAPSNNMQHKGALKCIQPLIYIAMRDIALSNNGSIPHCIRYPSHQAPWELVIDDKNASNEIMQTC